MDKLLPCPFCGGEAEVIGGSENWTPTFYDPDSGGDPIAVVCKTCACGLHFFDDYAEATTAWNRRALCENKYPDIGKPIQPVIDFCKNMKVEGHKLVL